MQSSNSTRSCWQLDEVKLDLMMMRWKPLRKRPWKKDTGARALRAIIEEFMLDIMYEIPKDDNIGKVTITREYIEGAGGPVIDIRNSAAISADGLKAIEVQEK